MMLKFIFIWNHGSSDFGENPHDEYQIGHKEKIQQNDFEWKVFREEEHEQEKKKFVRLIGNNDRSSLIKILFGNVN